MNTTAFRVLLITTLLGLLPLRAEYSPPTEGQLDQMMANPGLVVTVLKGADAKEAATLLKRVIDRVLASNLNASQRTYMIAYYTARFTFLLPASELNAFATELIPLVPRELVPSVISGFSLGGGGSSDFIAHVRELVQDNTAYVSALMTPRSSLTSPIHDRLVATLSVSQALPPSVTDSLPPPIPVGEAETQDEPPPPVPDTYDGQG